MKGKGWKGTVEGVKGEQIGTACREQDTTNRKLGGDQYTSYRCITLSKVQYIRFFK